MKLEIQINMNQCNCLNGIYAKYQARMIEEEPRTTSTKGFGGDHVAS